VYARSTLLEIDTVRVSLDDALEQLETIVLPQLREQPGFRGLYALTTPAGKAMLLSFWDTAEQADAGTETGWYPAVLAEYTTLFRSPPGRETYEVNVAVPPVTADSR
jgi:heme-degrading monooxygenase HmoA